MTDHAARLTAAIAGVMRSTPRIAIHQIAVVAGDAQLELARRLIAEGLIDGVVAIIDGDPDATIRVTTLEHTDDALAELTAVVQRAGELLGTPPRALGTIEPGVPS